MKNVVSTIYHQGKQVTFIDLSDVTDVDEAVQIVRQMTKQLSDRPASSMRVLYNLTNTIFSKVTLAEMDIFHRATDPAVIKSALFGVDGMMRVIVNTSARNSPRPVKIFEEKSAALDWLATDDDD